MRLPGTRLLDACPELLWLVECQCRAPLPPGWCKINASAGDASAGCVPRITLVG